MSDFLKFLSGLFIFIALTAAGFVLLLAGELSGKIKVASITADQAEMRGYISYDTQNDSLGNRQVCIRINNKDFVGYWLIEEYKRICEER